MPTTSASLAWQVAESLAQAATNACIAKIDFGRNPTPEEWAEVKRVRDIACDKLHILMAEMDCFAEQSVRG